MQKAPLELWVRSGIGKELSGNVLSLSDLTRLSARKAQRNHDYARINSRFYSETIAETCRWLDMVASALDAVVCCPLIAYPGTHVFDSLDMLCGHAKLDTPVCRATHHSPIHPSAEIDFSLATSLSLELEEVYSPVRLLSLQHNYRLYEGIL